MAGDPTPQDSGADGEEALLRGLPSVHELVSQVEQRLCRFPRSLVVDEARRLIAGAREALLSGRPAGIETLPARLVEDVEALERPTLRHVINATGVVLHTNLGRAPLGPVAIHGGYSNLEFDLAVGARGKRDVHAAALLERLLGAPAIVVNNNAAAVYLALNELAAGGEVIVSRGQLIEIGDGFRIPDIMARSGARLREVGATNRTRLEDYEAAFHSETRLVMLVHPSNFRILGFTGSPPRKQVAELAHRRGVPLYEDLGSGCLVDLRRWGIDEPTAQQALRDGADLISFSGDKLLGGPQAGILAGREELVKRLRRNPMFRALRLDKIIYQCLGQTLRHLLLERWDELPALRMIRMPAEQIRLRAEELAAGIASHDVEVVAGESVIGGGSTPEQSIPTWLVSVKSADVQQLAARLRRFDPPVVARIENDRLLLDLRTVFPDEEPVLLKALRSLL